jgi:hypothetical protein
MVSKPSPEVSPSRFRLRLPLVSGLVAVCVASIVDVAIAGPLSGEALARRAITVTDAQLVFKTTVANGRGVVDVTFQNRTASSYDVESHGRLESQALQVGRRFVRYIRSTTCFRLVETKRVAPLSPSSNRTPLLPQPQPGLHYARTANGIRWSETISGHTSFGSANFNGRFQIISGTLHEEFGGDYTWHFAQSYPSAIPRRDLAAPAHLCASER